MGKNSNDSRTSDEKAQAEQAAEEDRLMDNSHGVMGRGPRK